MTLSSSARESLELATAQYELFVPAARSFLAERGFDLAHASTYRLGVVVEPVIGHEDYTNRLSIPYLTKTGIVNIKFRCMENHVCKEEGCPKYLGLPHPTRIYNTQAFFVDSPVIGITEGEFDSQVIHEHVMPAVSIPGVQNWKPFYERCFVDYERVFLFADGDQPGKDFAKQISSILDGVTVVQMPESRDVNQVFLDEGAEGLRKRAGL